MGWLFEDHDPDLVKFVLSWVPPFLSRFRFEECVIELLTALFATSGALLHHFYGFGRLETVLGVGLSMCLLLYLDKCREICHCFCLLACSLLFGATVGPLINYFVDLDQRLIIFFMGGYALTVCFHVFGIRSRKLGETFDINLFNLPLLMSSFIFAHAVYSHGAFFNIDIPLNIQTVIPFVVLIPFIWYFGYLIYSYKTWDWGFVIPLHFMWLAVLSSAFHYNLLHLMCIYMFMVFVLHHLKLQDCASYRSAIRDGHIDRPVTNALTFYTNFVGRSSYLLIHFGEIFVDYIWEKIRAFYELVPGLMFCVKALKAGVTQLYLVKVFIVPVILASIIAVSLSILFFTFLAAKVQG